MKPATIRGALKWLTFTVALVLASPFILAARIEQAVSGGESVFVAQGQLLALVPGLPGSYLRSAYYYGTLDRCSSEVHIGFGSFFTHRHASLGANVAMGAYCVLGHVDIGDQVMMASRVSIPSGKSQHLGSGGELSAAPRFERIAVGGQSWIGEGAIILAQVGSHCIVSAGAVVINDAPSGHLIGGNPAKPIRELAGWGDAADRKGGR